MKAGSASIAAGARDGAGGGREKKSERVSSCLCEEGEMDESDRKVIVVDRKHVGARPYTKHPPRTIGYKL